MNQAATLQVDSTTTAWHALSADEVVKRLNTNAQSGLNQAEVARRLEEYGLNRLPTAGKRGPLMRFLLQFNNILVYVLLASAFVKLMLGVWLDAAIILGVVILKRCSASFRRERRRRP